ncbi:hypothetical protein [Kordiimonas sp.]|uniref:hypothetical protein n=1 Tax=Kordiimonas sp. TaxID=1970157 RepID=UPI003A8E9E78
MNREQTETFLKTLPSAVGRFVTVDVELIEVRDKAVLVEGMTGVHSKRSWLPKSQLAFVDRGNFGLALAVKRQWVAMKSLWWME